MSVDQDRPDAPHTGPADKAPATADDHGSGPGQVASEPRQGVGEAWSENRPEDWNPPAGNPGSDQDAQVPRDNGTARTDSEAPADLKPDADDAAKEEEMGDVDANNSVSSEHP